MPCCEGAVPPRIPSEDPAAFAIACASSKAITPSKSAPHHATSCSRRERPVFPTERSVA